LILIFLSFAFYNKCDKNYLAFCGPDMEPEPELEP